MVDLIAYDEWLRELIKDKRIMRDSESGIDRFLTITKQNLCTSWKSLEDILHFQQTEWKKWI